MSPPLPPAHHADQLYAQPLDAIAEFKFDNRVAQVFDNMIQRSVPGYATMTGMLGVLAAHYAQPDSWGYDLGCSLGAATRAMLQHVNAPGFGIVAVDNAPAMIERCRDNLRAVPSSINVELRCADIRDTPIENASVVLLNFTLQFLSPAERLPLLCRIVHGLRPGGVLLLAEKIAITDSADHDWHTDMHHAFKRANGYSELEISQKRTALENVLIPDTPEQHFMRLKQAGFTRMFQWFQCFNFAAFVAIK